MYSYPHKQWLLCWLRKKGSLSHILVVYEVIINDNFDYQIPTVKFTSSCVYVKDEVDPCDVPCTFINLSSEHTVLEKHMVIASLQLLDDSSIETEISHTLVDTEDENNYHAPQKMLGLCVTPQKLSQTER